MRLVHLEELQGNEVVARPILDINGRTLLSKGISIKLSYLDKLYNLGIYSIYIEDKISEGISIEDVLCDETRIHAKSIIQNEAQRYLKKGEIDSGEISKIVDVMIQEILSNKSGLVNLKDIRMKDDYTFAHSVNVCILSVMLAMKLGYDRIKIQNIGKGCILHDFGKVMVPIEILNHPGKLNETELIEMQRHPVYGYEALKNDPDISPTAKVVVLMHHERIDGSGYPSGLKGNKIHDSAKLCSICDTYDAMTSDRIYRKAVSISDTVEYLYCTSGIHFEKSFVDSFLQQIPIYPAGTLVMLNTGVIGIVVRNNKSNLTRPVVKILYNTKTRIKYNNNIVDMAEDLTLKIEREVKLDADTLKNM